MKLTALKDFNMGSMAQNYRAGDTLEVSAATGKDLIAAGLAEATDSEAEQADEPGNDGPEGRQTKPDPAAQVLTSKSISQ